MEQMECALCKKPLPDGGTETQDGAEVCSACLGNCFSCSNCGGIFLTDEGFNPTIDGDVCEDCIQDYVACENCNEAVHQEDAYSTGRGGYVCEYCRRREYARCEYCDELYQAERMVEVGTSLICSRCLENHYFYCDNSNEYYHDDYYGGEGLCTGCYEDEYGRRVHYDEDPTVTADEVAELVKMVTSDEHKKLYKLTVNKDDHRLIELQNVIGEVERPVYVYGLKDRDEYQISVSKSLLNNRIEKYLSERGWKFITVEEFAHRLGIAYTLRDKHFDSVVELVRIAGRR